MDKLLTFFKKYATVRNAFIAFALFLIVGQVLGWIDQPLATLANGERKLDFQIGYDISTVMRLFDAYGEQGRRIYTWDLLVDVLFPIAQAWVSILFILLVIRNSLWQKMLATFPLVFLATDLIENGLFLFFILTYPSLSPGLIDFASTITRIKRFTLYVSQIEMLVCATIVIVVFLKDKLTIFRLALTRK